MMRRGGAVLIYCTSYGASYPSSVVRRYDSTGIVGYTGYELYELVFTRQKWPGQKSTDPHPYAIMAGTTITAAVYRFYLLPFRRVKMTIKM